MLSLTDLHGMTALQMWQQLYIIDHKAMWIRIARNFFATAELNPYLSKQLSRNRLIPLRPLQTKSLQLYKKSNNVFINQIDSAGKTLAYVLPVLNDLLSTKRQKQSQWGAIIVTISKELCLQIYTLIRHLDSQNRLKVRRCGSLTHYSPVIAEMCKPSKDQDQDFIVNQMQRNLAESVNWAATDILITTPKMLYRILEHKLARKEGLAPSCLILDEADLILGNKQLLAYTSKSIAFLRLFQQKNIKYLLAAPSKHNLELLNQKDSKFPKANLFACTENVTEQTNLKSVRISYIKIKGNLKEQILKQKLQALVKLLTHPQRKRVLIFGSKQNLDAIRTAIVTKTIIQPSELSASFSTQKRILALYNFRQGNSNVLVSTDLISRGTDLGQPVDTIISFDLEGGQSQITRLCRINSPQGEYILLAEPSQSDKLESFLKAVEQFKKYNPNEPQEII